MSKFDIPMINVPSNNISEINDILNIGRQADVFKLKKEVMIKKVPVNVSDSNNNNLFHLILKDELNKTETGIINFFKYLIENNVNPEQPDNYNRTPLHYASMNHYNKIVDYLLGIGCNPNFKDNFGMTPMHYFMGGKIKLYKDKTPKPIINFSDKVDLNKKKEIREIKLEILKFLNDNYYSNDNNDFNYLAVFDKIFEEVMLSDSLVRKIKNKIINKSNDLISSDENKDKEMVSLLKEIRGEIESNVLDIFDPDKFYLDTDVKFDESVDTDSIYPNPDPNSNPDNLFILDNLTVPHYMKNIIIPEIDELRENLDDLNYRDNTPASTNKDKTVFENIIDHIEEYLKLDKNTPRRVNDFKTLMNDAINDILDPANPTNENDIEEITYFLNDCVELFNKISYLRVLQDFYGFKFLNFPIGNHRITEDGDNKKIDINFIYDFYLPIIEFDGNNYNVNDEYFKFDKSFFRNGDNIDGNYDDEFVQLVFNKRPTLERITNNRDLPYLFIEAARRTQKNMINYMIEFFIKKVIIENNRPNKINIPDELNDKINNFYNKNITFNDEKLNDINKKKLMVDLIKDVVIDYTKIRLNNKINKILQNLIDNTRLKFSRVEEIKSVLDIIDNDDIEFNLDVKIENKDNFNKKDDNKDKPFLVMSDDYSSLDLETEKLKVEINENTMLNFVINGGSLIEEDGNGKLPLDLLIENKYFNILNKLKSEGIEFFSFDKYSESLNYAIKIMKNNLSKITTDEFYDNQYKDLTELIESNNEFKYNIYKDNKLAFLGVNYLTKVYLKNNVIEYTFNKNLIKRKNYLIKNLNYVELMENEFKSLDSIKLIDNSIDKLQQYNERSEKYFSSDKYINNNKSKKAIFNILKLIGEEIVVKQIELFMKKIIYESYQNNYNPNDNDFTQIENIFKAGGLMKKSLHESLLDLNELFIKNSCKIFENQEEEYSFNYRTVSDYLSDFIDTIPLNIYVAYKPDDKMINILKSNVTNYFDNFIYNMYKNLLIVCENNFKFIINHNRNLNIIKNLT